MKKIQIRRADTGLEKVAAIAASLKIFFKDKQGGSYEMLGRLLEEAGEVATEVNKLEDNGVKRNKGEASVEKLCDEVVDVMKVLLQIVEHYDKNATAALIEAIDRELQVAIDHNVMEFVD